MLKVSAVIPAYNEADSVCLTIEALKGLKEINEVIVVDDGSTDGTFETLSGVRDIVLLRHEQNLGKGKTVNTGMKHVKNEYMLLVDADLKESASEVQKMLLQAGENRMVIGVLPSPEGKNGFGATKTTATAGFRLLTGKSSGSILSGQRIMPVSFIKSIALPGDYSLEFKLSLEAVRAGLEIVEVPVLMRNREYGRTLQGFCHRSRQCRQILRQIFKEVVNDKLYNHLIL